MANGDSNVDDDDVMIDTSTGYMLTTVDNPFDPFTQFKEWFSYDTAMGYHTASFLARVAQTSEELSEVDQHQAIQQAIDEIVQENVLGLYRKVLPNRQANQG
jgi:hypothetical protein